MDLEPRYIKNSFSIFIPREEKIRRLANDFEDLLEGKYFQPQIVPVPDNLDPEVPRMVFGSEHGFSKIVVSQLSIALNVSYSPDFQVDHEQRLGYLKERVPLLYELFGLLKDSSLLYCGMRTVVRIQFDKSNPKKVLDHILSYFDVKREIDDPYDLRFKTTEVIESRFFDNTTFANYRTWKLDAPPSGPKSFRSADAIELGVEIASDFNDRFSFSETDGYVSSQSMAHDVIERSWERANKTVTEFISSKQ